MRADGESGGQSRSPYRAPDASASAPLLPHRERLGFHRVAVDEQGHEVGPRRPSLLRCEMELLVCSSAPVAERLGGRVEHLSRLRQPARRDGCAVRRCPPGRPKRRRCRWGRTGTSARRSGCSAPSRLPIMTFATRSAPVVAARAAESAARAAESTAAVSTPSRSPLPSPPHPTSTAPTNVTGSSILATCMFGASRWDLRTGRMPARDPHRCGFSWRNRGDGNHPMPRDPP